LFFQQPFPTRSAQALKCVPYNDGPEAGSHVEGLFMEPATSARADACVTSSAETVPVADAPRQSLSNVNSFLNLVEAQTEAARARLRQEVEILVQSRPVT
jgi:hypothetical protein